MSGHTPGPWTLSGGSYIGICAMVDGISRQIGRAESVGHPPVIGDREVEANARLIGAAPDLLEALKLMQATLNTLSRFIDLQNVSDAGIAALDDAERADIAASAAIAKATGSHNA